MNKIVAVGPNSSKVFCPSCHSVVFTRVDHKATTRTHMIAGCMCFSILCWPFLCVPYCMNSCRNADHYCPNCDTYLGTYQR